MVAERIRSESLFCCELKIGNIRLTIQYTATAGRVEASSVCDVQEMSALNEEAMAMEVCFVLWISINMISILLRCILTKWLERI